MALARGLLAGWWLGAGRGLGGLSDLAPENKQLPAGLGHQVSPWVLPFLYPQIQSVFGPVTGSLPKVL